MTPPRIAIVVVYFGAPPFWLPAFLLSCRKNPDVDWLLYTDFDASHVPPNVSLKPLTLAQLNERVSRLFGATVHERPSLRKTCDFKSTYGVLFADDLRPYDFWAHSDLDIVWGDVRRFMTASLLRDHDIVSAARDKIAGHFALFRNTDAINRTFELVPGIVDVLSHPKYRHLDEDLMTAAVGARMRAGAPRSAPRVYWQDDLTVAAAHQRALGETERDTLWWRNGRTFDADGKELMYIHFHKLKPFMTTIDFGLDDSPAAFRIDRRGFLAAPH